MSKFCQNCGNQLDDNAVFCPNCGAKDELPAAAPAPEAPAYTAPQAPAYTAPQAPAYGAPEAPAYTAPQAPAYGAPEAPAYTAPQAPVYGAPAYAAPEGYAAPAPKDNKKLMIGIIAAVAAIAVIVVLVILLFGGGRGGYLGAIDTSIDVDLGDFDAIADLAPEEYWAWVEDEYDMSVDEIIERCDERYGDSVSEISVSVSFSEEECEELDSDEVEGIAEALEAEYDIKASNVSAVYDVKGEYTASWNGYEDSDTQTYSVVEIDGDFYVFSYYEDDGSYSVSFDAAQSCVYRVED
ncbi:MAG: zinc-ribbon domain-containing protein [Clostridia bacterium]|nr:zinc-ribbon domain-containing protein [Clostridia bacterium]